MIIIVSIQVHIQQQSPNQQSQPQHQFDRMLNNLQAENSSANSLQSQIRHTGPTQQGLSLTKPIFLL